MKKVLVVYIYIYKLQNEIIEDKHLACYKKDNFFEYFKVINCNSISLFKYEKKQINVLIKKIEFIKEEMINIPMYFHKEDFIKICNDVLKYIYLINSKQFIAKHYEILNKIIYYINQLYINKDVLNFQKELDKLKPIIKNIYNEFLQSKKHFIENNI